MKHLKKIFESEEPKLMDDYYKQADEIRKRFRDDMNVLGNKFIEDVQDCMHELTDRADWVTENESDGLFFRNYIFTVEQSDFEEFVAAVNDSLNKIENHLGIKYTFSIIDDTGSRSTTTNIESLKKFNKDYYYYLGLYYKKRKTLVFKIYLG